MMQAIQETYTTAELATILSISRKNVWLRGLKENWSFVEKPNRLGGNVYPYSGLPADVKAAIAKHEADKAPKKIIDGAVIPDWSHRIGLARYQVVAAWRGFCEKSKAKKTEATETFLLGYNNGQMVKDAFDIVGEVKKSTLYKWDLTLRENGDDYYSICDHRGKWDKGGAKGLGQLTPEAQTAFLAAWLTPNQPSVTLAYNVMAAVLGKKNIEIPSLSSVYRYAKRYEQLNYNIYVLKRQGEKALTDKVLPYIHRDSNLLEVGDCLFADGHTLNFECLHPETGKPFRPTLIVWYDWKSDVPVGWEIMPVENTVAISSALYMGIIRLGKYPKIVYLDNGRAFKSKFFTGEDDDFEALSGLYARLGIALQLAKPYHARSKKVERFFRDYNEQCARLMPSYIGRDIYDKPAWRARNEKYHQKLHEKRAGIPTLRQAMEVFEAYVHWYAEQPHARIPGKTRGEVFKARQGSGVDVTELDRHFLWSKKVKPKQCGFTLAGVRYESDSLLNLNCEIVIKFSWADLSVVHLYDYDGHSLGKAYPQKEVHPVASKLGDAHDQAMVADHNRRQSRLKKETMQESRRLDDDFKNQPGFTALSYIPDSASLGAERPALPAPEPVYDLSEEERARLEAVYENAVRDMAARPEIERPHFFQSEYDKYDWCFNAKRKGATLDTADLAFMSAYEESYEYRELVGGRYELLKDVDKEREGAMQ